MSKKPLVGHPDSPVIEGMVVPIEGFKGLQQQAQGSFGGAEKPKREPKKVDREPIQPLRDAQGRIIIGGGDDAPDPNGQMG